MEDRYVQKVCSCGRTFSDFKDGTAIFCSDVCKDRDRYKKQKQKEEERYAEELAKKTEKHLKSLEDKLSTRAETISELRDIIKEQNVEIIEAKKEAFMWKELAERGVGAVLNHYKTQIEIRQDVIYKYINFFNDHKHEWEAELGRQYDQPTRWPLLSARSRDRKEEAKQTVEEEV